MRRKSPIVPLVFVASVLAVALVCAIACWAAQRRVVRLTHGLSAQGCALEIHGGASLTHLSVDWLRAACAEQGEVRVSEFSLPLWTVLRRVFGRPSIVLRGEEIRLGVYRATGQDGHHARGTSAAGGDVDGDSRRLRLVRISPWVDSLSLAFERSEARYGDSVVQATDFQALVQLTSQRAPSVADDDQERGRVRLRAGAVRAVSQRMVFTTQEVASTLYLRRAGGAAESSGDKAREAACPRGLGREYTDGVLRVLNTMADAGFALADASVSDGVAEWHGGQLSVPGDVRLFLVENPERSAKGSEPPEELSTEMWTSALGEACEARAQSGGSVVCISSSGTRAGLGAVKVEASLYDEALKDLVGRALGMTLSGAAGVDGCNGQLAFTTATGFRETRVAHTRLGSSPLTMPAVRIRVDGALSLASDEGEVAADGVAVSSSDKQEGPTAGPFAGKARRQRQKGESKEEVHTDEDHQRGVARAVRGFGGWSGKSSGVVELGQSRLPFGFEFDGGGNLVAGLGPLNCQDVLQNVPVPWLGAAASLEWQGELDLEIRFGLGSGASGWPVRIAIDRRQVCRPYGRRVADVLRAAHYQQPFVHVLRQSFYGDMKVRLGPGSGEHWSLAAMSGPWVASVLAHEDAAFFRHRGISVSAIEEAFRKNAEAERIRFGGSTLTMQLAKNLYLPFERTLLRKFQEWLLTTWIESTWRKEEILELYLNIIELGPHLFGSRAAAHHYFGKTPAQLNWAESALLAVALPSPRTYGPRLESAALDAGYARSAQRFLSMLAEREIMTAAEHAAASFEIDRRVSGQRNSSRSTTQQDAYSSDAATEVHGPDAPRLGAEYVGPVDDRYGSLPRVTNADAPSLFVQDTRLQCRFAALPASRCRALKGEEREPPDGVRQDPTRDIGK